MKKIIILILIISLLVPAVTDAYLGAVITLATILRVGAVYIAQLWRNTAVRDAIASVLGHVAVGTLAYLAYDRGADKPSTERYVTVSLAGVKAKLQSYKDAGFFPNPTFATSLTQRYSLVCNGYSGQWYTPVPLGALMCGTSAPSCGGTLVVSSTEKPTVNSTCVNCSDAYVNWRLCTSGDIVAYNNSVALRGENADKVVNDVIKKAEINKALGEDIQKGGTLSSTVPSGAYVVEMGGDVYENGGYGDSNDFISAGSGSNVPSDLGTEITKQEVKEAVGDALTEKLGSSDFPADPSFDSGLPSGGSQPTETNYKGLLTDFFNTHPLRAISHTAQITTSSPVCYIEGIVNGTPLRLSFCELEGLLHLLGIAFVLVCTVRSFFIAMGVGE